MSKCPVPGLLKVIDLVRFADSDLGSMIRRDEVRVTCVSTFVCFLSLESFVNGDVLQNDDRRHSTIGIDHRE